MIMRKHTITAYTFKVGDILYHFNGQDIQAITLTEEHISDTPKAIVGESLIKPNAKVEQKRNGQLVLWHALTCDYGWIVSEVEQYKRYRYSEHATTLFVDEASCRLFMERKLAQKAKRKMK